MLGRVFVFVLYFILVFDFMYIYFLIVIIMIGCIAFYRGFFKLIDLFMVLLLRERVGG